VIALDNLDESTPFMVQLNTVGPGPVTIINTIVAPEDQMAEVMAAWKKDSDVMRASAGFISAQLYGGVAGSRVLTNIAVWESGETFARHSSIRRSRLSSPSTQTARSRSRPSSPSWRSKGFAWPEVERGNNHPSRSKSMAPDFLGGTDDINNSKHPC